MCKVSQVGLVEARIELQVVILAWLGTAAKLAVHLAQVSQVDQVQVIRFLAELAAIGLVSMTRHDLQPRFPRTGGCGRGCGNEISLVIPR